MSKKTFITIMVTLFLIFTIGCSQKPEDAGANDAINVDLLISAASSLTEALQEIKEVYEKEHGTVNVTFNFGGSGKLAQQIEQGAPVDIYISADPDWINQLEKKSLIIPETRVDFTSNRLVLIGGKNVKGKITSLDDVNISEIKQIAIGEPESVPAGKYTKQTLEKVGQWENIQSKLVLAKDVRQVLTYVESGNADLGFVYLSDALLSDHVKILTEIEDHLHSPIIYPVAIVAESKQKAEANQFIDFLQSETAQAILEKYGFKK